MYSIPPNIDINKLNIYDKYRLVCESRGLLSELFKGVVFLIDLLDLSDLDKLYELNDFTVTGNLNITGSLNVRSITDIRANKLILSENHKVEKFFNVVVNDVVYV